MSKWMKYSIQVPKYIIRVDENFHLHDKNIFKNIPYSSKNEAHKLTTYYSHS
jgi:hypothetical protein